MIELSEDQKAAFHEIEDWLHNKPKKSLTLGGYAGSGKTELISALIRRMKGVRIAVCAFTGKAAHVLRKKGVRATTVHKLMYQPEYWCKVCDEKSDRIKGFDGKFRCAKCERAGAVTTRWKKVPIINADLVIVDEASMLYGQLILDLEALVSKILYVGDHGQLEPVGDDPGLMHDPDIRLEKIHRQADGSGIILFAHHLRRGSAPQRWDGGFDDVRVCGISKATGRVLSRYNAVLCGYNNTRKAVNAGIRDFRGYGGDIPEVGERLICLQNDTDLGFFNGMLVTVTKIRKSYDYPRYDLIDDAENEYFDIKINPDQFQEEKRLEDIPKGIGLFDFGYCMTTHKSQGSEWDKVLVIEQIARSWDPARWRYTAATRAAKHLEYWIPSGRI